MLGAHFRQRVLTLAVNAPKACVQQGCRLSYCPAGPWGLRQAAVGELLEVQLARLGRMPAALSPLSSNRGSSGILELQQRRSLGGQWVSDSKENLTVPQWEFKIVNLAVRFGWRK
ncbi:hypothetical protein NDU88_005204 [Pleurodeles waltl]|uniref:Uncharacterized protein n=1 Tax=Pleurodeles waltl TaxID=8319 RepID=A0AAV7RHV2_PLEWA|nr:hypothetical protein NDU88_005204 [Pleurodeles waltl]